MILTGDEILREVRAGRITIDPFDEGRLAPNSYDLTLAPTLLRYAGLLLDVARDNPTVEVVIPEGGLTIYPGEGYLASTVEACGSDHYVCDVDGKSSLGRLFLGVHVTAGRGDVGFGVDGTPWTLELHCASRHPVTVRRGMKIAQARFTTVIGDVSRNYRKKGKYVGLKGPRASRSWQDFQGET